MFFVKMFSIDYFWISVKIKEKNKHHRKGAMNRDGKKIYSLSNS